MLGLGFPGIATPAVPTPAHCILLEFQEFVVGMMGLARMPAWGPAFWKAKSEQEAGRPGQLRLWKGESRKLKLSERHWVYSRLA